MKNVVQNFINKRNRYVDELKISYEVFDRLYWMEYLSYLISNSKYKNLFIFKGGFLITELIKNNIRTTIDIDFSFANDINKDKLDEIFNFISLLAKDDGVNMQITKIDHIAENTDKIGLSYHAVLSFGEINQKIYLKFDIVSGDVITPEPDKKEIKSFILGLPLNLNCYNTETIISEKLFTTYNIVKENGYITRIKDIWDIHLLFKFFEKNIDFNILKKACKNTFNNNKNEFSIIDVEKNCIKIFDTTNKKQKDIIINWFNDMNIEEYDINEIKKSFENIFKKMEVKY